MNRAIESREGNAEQDEGVLSAPGESILTHEDLDATLWMKTSAEYQVLCISTFSQALDAVDAGLDDKLWTALPRQQSIDPDIMAQLPTAVILDVDETVLDNSTYQAECVLNSPFQFDPDKWNQWCNQAQATAVPGVADFLSNCRKRGIAIRFVTNRDGGAKGVRQATLENLRRLGLAPADQSAESELLCKQDQPEWGSDKSNRREFVASTHRILVMIGDDLNDFLWSGEMADCDQRIFAAFDGTTYWGKRWFMLPNANYGGWEKAIQNYQNGLSREDSNRMKMNAVRAKISGQEKNASSDLPGSIQE